MGLRDAAHVPQAARHFVSRVHAPAGCVAVVAAGLLLAGCWKPPTLDQPRRLQSVDEERAAIVSISQQQEEKYATAKGRARKRIRNEIVTELMHAIDLEYTVYEARLTHEAQAVSFGLNAASLGLTTTASLIPVAQTTRLLSGIATGVNGLDTAYDQKIMFTHAIQNVQTQMRASRNEQAARILSKLTCSTTLYPLGMAKSDIEGYYRAGTFTSGLINVSNTINRAETQSMAQKEAASPASPASSTAAAAATRTIQNEVARVTITRNRDNCPLTQQDRQETRGDG